MFIHLYSRKRQTQVCLSIFLGLTLRHRRCSLSIKPLRKEFSSLTNLIMSQNYGKKYFPEISTFKSKLIIFSLILVRVRANLVFVHLSIELPPP
jgi:hypothetical protein